MLFTHFRRKSDSTTETESEISSDSSQSLEEQTEENNVLDSESREVITKLLDDKEIENLESVEHRVFNIKESNLVDQDGDLDPHLCSECLTGPAILRCVECQDAFCFTCFKMIHRSGNRQFHKTESMDNDGDLSTSTVPGNFCSSLPPSVNAISSKNECSDLLIQRSKYIPLRLTLLERKKMRLVEATLHVSEYTDRMDVAKFIDKKNRTLQQLREICAILTGVLISLDYEEGQLLMDNREFCKYEKIYQELFEIPRRYKILNPERMRSSYGKLMYFLQDTCVSEIQNLLQLNCIRPMRTVYSLLAERGKLALLKDSTVETATKVITSAGKSRSEVQRDIKKKNAAVAYLARTYSSSSLSKEEIERCLHSINDNNTFLYANRDPCEKMIGYLKKYFKPDSFEPGYSLVITAGADGARLSHSHTRQYYYCLQSLTLWREILHNFYQLWFCTEKDLLSNSNSYELKDTGQGLNRLHDCPETFRLMQEIFLNAQREVDQWIGSAVFHLGDHNVPNALTFISKYTQISQILTPICSCLQNIKGISENKYIAEYIKDEFGGIELLTKTILKDFFCRAFDGSGADNFYDAGSCIDGRLTSAWNWCSQLKSKPFYYIFLLTGFIGFDGEFT